MVDLGCQDIDWVGRNDNEGLDAILLPDGLIPATLSVDKEKCDYLGCIFVFWGGPEGALRGPLGLQMVDLG